MLPSQAGGIRTLGQFLKSVRARRVEQTVIGDIAADIGDDERFHCQVRDARDHIDPGNLVVADNDAGRFHCEVAAEYPRRRNTIRSICGSRS